VASSEGGNRRGRPCFGAALAAMLLLFSLGALGEVRIGALQEDVSHWQEVVARAQAAARPPGFRPRWSGIRSPACTERCCFPCLGGRAWT